MTKGYDIITPWRPWFLATPPQTEAHPMFHIPMFPWPFQNLLTSPCLRTVNHHLYHLFQWAMASIGYVFYDQKQLIQRFFSPGF